MIDGESGKAADRIISRTTDKENGKLIAFYSRADENYVSGALKYLETGNTEVAAGIIHRLTGADMFKIEQTKPYSKEYNECIAQAQLDQRNDARPELISYPESIDQYQIIYLGFPNYWSTMPMAVFTFLEHFASQGKLAGKIIKPFCTHEGSGMGSSERDIRSLCPDAVIMKGLAIHGTDVKKSVKSIERWAKK